MDDKKNEVKVAEKDAKAVKAKTSQRKDDSKDKTVSLKAWLLEIRGEFKKIIWPNKDDLMKETVTVICTSVIIGVVIIGMDFVFGGGYQLFLDLAAKI